MKSIEILAVGLRLVGIYMLPLFLISLGRIVVMFHQVQSSPQNSSRFLLIVGVGCILHLALMLLLILFPARVAELFVPKTKANSTLFEGSAKDIQTALFCVFGIYTLSKALPDLVYNGLWIAKTGWNFSAGTKYVINQITTIVQFGVGLYLCLQAKGLSELLHRIRESGDRVIAPK